MSLLKILLTASLMTTGLFASAQRMISGDTIAVTIPRPEQKEHSPRQAIMLATILPGAGQIYNKKWWKVPFVYGGFGTLLYFIDYNNDFYVLYRKAYADIVDDDDTTNSFKDVVQEGYWDWNNPAHVTQFTTKLQNAKRTVRRYRDLCIIGTAAFYALTIIDSAVDAHLFGFDISDDLTFNWAPQQTQMMNQPVWGLQLTLNF